MQDHAVEQTPLPDPRLSLERAPGVGMTGLPAAADAGRGEVDVLGMGLIAELRAQQTHHMHARVAAVAGQLLVERIVLFLLRYELEEVGDEVPELVRLALAYDVAGDPARILDVLLTIEDLPDGLRLISRGMPQMHGEDQRVAAW